MPRPEEHTLHGRLSSFRTSEKREYLVPVLFMAVFFVIGTVFIYQTASLAQKATTDYIQKATQLTTTEVDEHIEDIFVLLNAAAILPEDRPVTADDAIFDRVTQRLGNYATFVRVGIADTDGNAIWAEGFKKGSGSLADEPFIARALAGEDVITETRFDEIGNVDVNYYAVPIRRASDGEVQGALFAADPQAQLQAITERTLYAGQGFSHIVDRHGDYIVESKSPLVASRGENMFNLDPPPNPQVMQRILDSMAAGQPIQVEVTIDGIHRTTSFEPLDHNGWYVFYSVPTDMVGGELRMLAGGSIALMAIAAIVFAVFAFIIWRTNKKGKAKLEHLAYVDPITGKANLQKFMIDADAELARLPQDGFAICYQDIKGFKFINDLFGREVGDDLLRFWADHLEQMSYPGELFARIQDDVFVSLRRCLSYEEIEARFESLAHTLETFPTTFSQGYKIEWFAGAYRTNGDGDTLTIRDMIDRARIAQDSVKWSGKGRHVGFYTSEMREEKLWEKEVEAQMGPALANGEFEVYLQPKVAIADGDRIEGAEALVRWNSPTHGMVMPGRFIDLFEHNGFVVELDRFVFEEACRHYCETVLEGDVAPYRLSVNVSRRGVLRPDFITAYAAMKNKYGIPDGVLELEFTESLAMENLELFQTSITLLHSLGLQCSIDDFGSGYSSLNLLQSLDVDVLKLDRSFFTFNGNAERGLVLIRSTIELAKNLGMSTVAEGIDEQWQVDALREMGCDLIQGYFFAKPMPLDEFDDFKRGWRSP